MSGEHAPNDILVDLDPEGPSDLLGDAHAAKVRIATVQGNDGGDGADATGAEELREGDQQVDDKDEDFSHGANRTMATTAYKAEIAVELGTAREVVSRHVRHYEANGWVALRRGRLELLDIAALQQLAANGLTGRAEQQTS